MKLFFRPVPNERRDTNYDGKWFLHGTGFYRFRCDQCSQVEGLFSAPAIDFDHNMLLQLRRATRCLRHVPADCWLEGRDKEDELDPDPDGDRIVQWWSRKLHLGEFATQRATAASTAQPKVQAPVGVGPVRTSRKTNVQGTMPAMLPRSRPVRDTGGGHAP